MQLLVCFPTGGLQSMNKCIINLRGLMSSPPPFSKDGITYFESNSLKT